ncbi:MAG: site-specific DNA-methyltransferase [bacterium]
MKIKTQSKAVRNRTMELSKKEILTYKKDLLKINKKVVVKQILNKTIAQNIFQTMDFLPSAFVDLLFIDPPYNLTKTFNENCFKEMSINDYSKWMDGWLKKMIRFLKPDASIYICGDWRSSSAVQLVCEKYFIIRNRITFEREKGRGAKQNWKNNSEDIWFCTLSDDYYFNPEAVKLKRKVLAPYRENGIAKDWTQDDENKYRWTSPSNVWTDITIPFWSMSENTPHPTQKPEKLLAKIILASSKQGDVILDPFAGVGTTGVVAKKLKRNFVMIEVDETYCLYAQKRLAMAENDSTIQGYSDGIFWERNALSEIKKTSLSFHKKREVGNRFRILG